MDDNWFAFTDSDAGGMNLDTSGFDFSGAEAPGYYENAADGAQFDWSGSDLNLTDSEQQALTDYLTANPDALDYAYGDGLQGFLNSAGNSVGALGNLAKGAGSWLGGLSTNTLGAGALLASGIISAKEAEDLQAQQIAGQKELLQYKHDLEKPTSWVTPQRGLLRLQ